MHERPATLERPVLIGAFRGWNDGGQAATLAAGYLARLWGARKFAEIDPELFVDFQATRPMVSLEGGRTRKIEWPENTFYRARIPEADRDAILLVGVEPNYRWRTFSELVTELAARSRRRARDHARSARGRRAAHAAGAGDRRCDGSPARGRARAPALPLRGPNRHRRGAPRLVPTRGHPVREPVGRGAALRPARAQPACSDGAL